MRQIESPTKQTAKQKDGYDDQVLVHDDENNKNFRTPPKKESTNNGSIVVVRRRRANGSPVLPLNSSQAVKKVYMIRHGESLGQVAHLHGLNRRTDSRLLDCDLTEKGCDQARAISNSLLCSPTVGQGQQLLQQIQLVVSSPLTRALHTSLLAFPDKPILVHYDLREVGISKAPENIPRDMGVVLKDLHIPLGHRDQNLLFDIVTHQPSDWPRDYSPNVVKRDRIRKFFHWLHKERPEMNIAVVCHHNVIRAATVDGETIRPRNGEPIACLLHSNGDLLVAQNT